MVRASVAATVQATETERAAKRERRGLKILLHMRELSSHQLIRHAGSRRYTRREYLFATPDREVRSLELLPEILGLKAVQMRLP
jgi:hypothetical protein